MKIVKHTVTFEVETDEEVHRYALLSQLATEQNKSVNELLEYVIKEALDDL